MRLRNPVWKALKENDLGSKNQQNGSPGRALDRGRSQATEKRSPTPPSAAPTA